MDDTEITELFFERSQTAVSQTAQKYGGLITRIALNILGSSEDAEEVVNDVLARLWDSIPPERPQSLKAYACRIARNLSINRMAGETAKKRGGEFLKISAEWLEIFPCDEFDSEVALKDVFERFLDTLDAESRRIFVRRYWFADNVKDIAQLYRVSESKVKSSLFRTRKKMKEYLMKEGITA